MNIFELIAFCILLALLCIWVKASKPDENIQAKKVVNKFFLYLESISFMILAKDSKGLGPKKNPDPDIIKGAPASSKRIIFIRHGESDWNEVFNKGINPSFILRLANALFREFKLFTSLDSGLSYNQNLFKLYFKLDLFFMCIPK